MFTSNDHLWGFFVVFVSVKAVCETEINNAVGEASFSSTVFLCLIRLSAYAGLLSALFLLVAFKGTPGASDTYTDTSLSDTLKPPA